VVNENIMLDTWFTLFEDHYEALIMIIKINHGATTREKAQPQEL
jgi:hypothetical protein